MRTKLAIICSRQENGAYFALCPDIKSCFTQADTYEDAVENLKALIVDMIQDMNEEEKAFITYPQSRIFSELEVAI